MKISVAELCEMIENHADKVAEQHREIIDLRRKLDEVEKAKRNPDPGAIVLRVDCVGGLAEFYEADPLGKVLSDRRFSRDALLRALARGR